MAVLLGSEARAHYHVPGPGPYFLAHAAGARPIAADAALEQHYLAPWRTLGNDAWPIWLAAVEDFRTSLARVIGGAASEICPQPNVSAALDRYLGALPRTADRTVILMAQDSFPSLGYVALAAKERGFSIRFLPGGDATRDPKTWADAIDERTAIVLAMHVTSTSGVVAPVADIATLARRVGARTVVDVAQSVGVVAVAPRQWGVDALVGSCLKWLSGGPGAGFLWVPERDFETLRPQSIGWFSHENPFEMDIHNFRYAPDALRFWGGTPDIAPFVLARAGIDTVLGIGPEAIRDHNRALQQHFRSMLERKRPQWSWPGEAIGGTLCIDVGDDREALEQQLAANHIRADFRGSIVRLSFAAWNSQSEVEAVAKLLAD